MQSFIEQTRTFLSSKSLRAIEVILMGLILLLGFTRDIASVEFFPDESFWVVSSVRFDEFISGDFDSPVWTEDPIIIFEVRPVPSYFSGISQRLGGISTESLPPDWDWGLSEDENIALGAMPNDEMLWWSRIPMAILSAFSLFFTAVFLAKQHSRLAAYLFTLVSLNGYFLLNLRRAMSEASILFFTVLVMYASYRLMTSARNRDMNKSIQWALIAGFFSGLAGQSKLTGLVCVGIAILGAVLVITPYPKQWLTILKQRLLLVIMFVVTFATLATFIASYPFYYTDTVDRIWETFYARDQIVKYQLATYIDELIPPGNRLTILFQRIFDYPIHTDTNNTVGILFHWLNLIGAFFGIIHVLKCAWNDGSKRDISIVLLLGTLLCAVPMLFSPFDWERYYLFPIYFGCIFFVIGISELALNFRIQEKTK